MASTYSNLKFELIGTGDQPGAWGTTTNTNLGTAIEQALVGMATISSGFVTNSLTLTLTDTNAAQNARALVLNLTQALSGAGTLNVPAIQKPYMIINATGQTVTVKVTGLTGVAVPNGTRAFLYNNGTDVGEFFNYHSSLTLGTALPVASGGTGSSTACGARTNLGLGTIATQPASNVNISGGSITGITDLAVADGGTGSSTACGARTNLGLGSIATQAANNVSISGGSITGITDLAVADGGTGASTAPNARTNLGATTVGSNLFTLTNPSAITFLRINADNTVSTLDAATFRTAIGAGTGSGSVASVSGTGTVQGLSLSGTVTTTGSLTLGGSLSAVSLTTQVSGTLPVANGGTGAATFTANNVLLGNGTSAFQVVAAGTSGNVLTSNGTTWTSAAAAGGGANIQSFTATGTYTKPPGAKFVYVELWGGGGGGQAGYSLMNPPGGCTGGTAFGGGGGSGGGYTYRMFAAPVVGATETVTIGAGGAGGTAATAPCPSGPGGFGTNGGTTNFGTLLFAGGGTICGGGAVVAGSLSYRQNIVAPGPGFAYTASVAQIQIIGGPASSIPFTPLANLSQCYTKRELGGMWSGGGGGITRCPSSLVPSPGPFYPEVGKGRNSMFGAGGGGGGASKAGGNCPSITITSGGTGGAGRIYGTNAASTSVSTGGSGGPSPGGAGSAGSCFNGGGGGASAVITPSITTAGAGGAGGAGGGGGGGGGGAVAPFTPPGTKRAGAGGAGGNGLAVVYTW